MQKVAEGGRQGQVRTPAWLALRVVQLRSPSLAPHSPSRRQPNWSTYPSPDLTRRGRFCPPALTQPGLHPGSTWGAPVSALMVLSPNGPPHRSVQTFPSASSPAAHPSHSPPEEGFFLPSLCP